VCHQDCFAFIEWERIDLTDLKGRICRESLDESGEKGLQENFVLAKMAMNDRKIPIHCAILSVVLPDGRLIMLVFLN